MNVHIAGIGTARPPVRIDQAQAAEAAVPFCSGSPAEAKTLAALYRRTQVGQRASVLLSENGKPAGNGQPPATQSFFTPPDADHPGGPPVSQRMQVYGQHATPLAAEAALAALDNANTRADQIGQLVVVTCTGFGSPGLDVRLIDTLNLRRDVGRTTIGFMGCHGALNGLRVARSLAMSEHAPVLLCAVELCSLHFQYGWNPQQIVANALFADGAAAVVVKPHDESFKGDPTKWRIDATGSCLVPDSADAMTWRIGDHGFEMTLSPKVPELIRANVRAWLTQWLECRDLKLDDVGSWAIHPGGPRVIDAVEEALDLPQSAGEISRHILRSCGNMSSPTLLFILDELQKRRATGPCVMLAFGPGLMVEAALLGNHP